LWVWHKELNTWGLKTDTLQSLAISAANTQCLL
jgi:hypothetical protein